MQSKEQKNTPTALTNCIKLSKNKKEPAESAGSLISMVGATGIEAVDFENYISNDK